MRSEGPRAHLCPVKFLGTAHRRRRGVARAPSKTGIGHPRRLECLTGSAAPPLPQHLGSEHLQGVTGIGVVRERVSGMAKRVCGHLLLVRKVECRPLVRQQFEVHAICEL